MSTQDHDRESPRNGRSRGRDLTTGSIPRHLVAFSLPMFAGSFLQTAYSVINAVWVGTLGKTALAAVTESFPIFFLLMAVAGGLTMAANILVSQSYGAKDWQQLRRVVRNSTLLAAAISVGCLVTGLVYARPLLQLMHTPANVLDVSAEYMRIFLWSTPAMFGIFLVSSTLRGAGDSTTPLGFQAVFVTITAVLDPLLMFGWLGFPKLGLNGTAVATIITNWCAFASVLIYLQVKRHIVAPDWRHLRGDLATGLLIIRIGLPSMLQQASVSLGMLVIVGLVNVFGENGAAAFGAAIRIDQIAFMPAMITGMAVSSLAGQNIGARSFSRVKDVYKWGLVVGCGVTLLATLFVVGLPGLTLRMFTQDPKVIDIGVRYLRIVGPGYVLLAVMFVSNGIINGAGHTFFTTIASVIALWVVRVPLATYLVHRYHHIEGIWYSMVIGFAVGAVVSLAYYYSGRWKTPVSKGIFKSPSMTSVAQAEEEAVSPLPLFDPTVE